MRGLSTWSWRASRALNGTGNSLANDLLGNDGKNDLVGDAGNDTLNGGLDDDTMTGGLGNDTYFVDAAGDVIVETAGQGKDAVISSVSFTITQDIETLVLQSSNTVTGAGNQLANTITMIGTGQALLGGIAGNDTLTGGVNDDLVFGDNDNDVLAGGDGADRHCRRRRQRQADRRERQRYAEWR